MNFLKRKKEIILVAALIWLPFIFPCTKSMAADEQWHWICHINGFYDLSVPFDQPPQLKTSNEYQNDILSITFKPELCGDKDYGTVALDGIENSDVTLDKYWSNIGCTQTTNFDMTKKNTAPTLMRTIFFETGNVLYLKKDGESWRFSLASSSLETKSDADRLNIELPKYKSLANASSWLMMGPCVLQ